VSEAALRLFVALELAPEAREELVRWRAAAVGGDTVVRPVAPEALHVTLCFLGALPGGAVAPVLAACTGAAELPAACLALGGALWLPRRAPRVLAVELHDAGGRLGAVQARLSAALAADGWFTPEPRPFLAHVSVGRVRRGARVRDRDLANPAPVQFSGHRVSLFRSVLGRGGARYDTLGGVDLAG
jgi:2'-5' RNA ligase